MKVDPFSQLNYIVMASRSSEIELSASLISRNALTLMKLFRLRKQDSHDYSVSSVNPTELSERKKLKK